MKKIVIVGRNFSVGGAENMICNLVSNIDPDKYNVTVIITNMRCNNHLEERIEKAGVKTIYLNKRSSKKVDISKAIAFFKMWKALSVIKPDIIHTHLGSGIYTFPYVLFHNIKLIHTVHSLPNKDIPRITQVLFKFLVILKKAIPVGISDTIVSCISSHYKICKEEIPLIYNGVDINKFKTKRNPKESFNLCIVGRLSTVKNHKMLIEAFEIAHRRNARLNLEIVGDGELRDQLVELVNNKGLNNCVRFLGERSDIPDILSGAYAFILPSLYEGLPLCLLEAMASGLPIIATNVGGVPDIIKHNRNGFLVESGDIQGLSEAIIKMVEDANLYNEISRNNIEDSRQYDISIMTDKYMQLYEIVSTDQNVQKLMVLPE